MKRCPKCNSLMPDEAGRCIKCGLDTFQGSAPAARTAATIAPFASATTGARPGRLRIAWLLVKQSWHVLMLDKELLVFPLVSGIASLLVLAGFIAGAFATGVAGDRPAAPVDEATVWAWVFAYYFVSYFVIVFFNSALVACALIRFQGGNPTVVDGLRAASARIPQIVAWALLAATVGVVLRAVQERVQFLGRIMIALLGAAWTVATYFVVPVLVVERLGPVDALKRSAALMKQTWGESLTSNVGVGAAFLLISVLFVLVAGGASAALFVQTGSLALLIAGGVVIVAGLLLAALVSSALNAIVLSALYLYAAEKKVPQAFEGLGQVAFARR